MTACHSSVETVSPFRALIRRRMELADKLKPEPDYTHHLTYDAADGLWYVTCRVTATGQAVRCGYYQRPADERVPVIAARLYGLRKW